MLHLPILRKGRPYKSVDVARVVHHRTREPFVESSQANPGLIRRDLLDQAAMSAPLRRMAMRELITLSQRAAEHFATDALPVGDEAQTPEQYVAQVSATTGLPHALARRHVSKIRGVLSEIDRVVAGLTRQLDLSILDAGTGSSGGLELSFIPRGDALGIVLPSNSPGVHTLWAPAIALKTALVLKPGGAEPWTPYRLIQAFLKAGAPEEAFSYYPTDHAGAGEILRLSGRAIVFGDATTVGRWAADPRVELHGPGYSKILLGPDQADAWANYLDLIETSILENSGRSCVNASGVWVTAHAEEIALALAQRLARVGPRAAEDPAAQLAPFADPRVAQRISATIDELLRTPGARDVSAAERGGGRLVEFEGCSYLLPTIVVCDSPEHPLANREFLFPFAAVVKARVEELPERLGTTLALSALTDDDALVRRLVRSPLVQRLNLGPIPTQQVAWDQPHEGNLFEHLWQRRALQRAVSA
jgi:acyl-CoA reductase-like NAD-dependent aldehyde dehydrogenase